MVATYSRDMDQIRAGAPRPCLSCYGLSFRVADKAMTIALLTRFHSSEAQRAYVFVHPRDGLTAMLILCTLQPFSQLVSILVLIRVVECRHAESRSYKSKRLWSISYTECQICKEKKRVAKEVKDIDTMSKAKKKVRERQKKYKNKGQRVVDLCELGTNRRCSKCKSVLDLENIVAEKKCGLYSILSIVCNECNITSAVHTEKIIEILYIEGTSGP